MPLITIDTSSPECGWQPFLDWLLAQGLDPMGLHIRSITIDPETKTASMVIGKRNEHGHLYTEGNEVVTRTVAGVKLSSLPPRHP